MTSSIIKVLPIVAIFIAWFYTYSKGITTAIDIWIISEIFNHCLLVIPGAFFLIYQKRTQLLQQPFVPNYWLLLPLTGTLLLYTFGYVGDIRLFMHIATFVSLPVLIWFILGNKAAKTIAFPLYFMLFAIPVGEQLIPYLQELTTDLSVPLLEITGVPIYRNGLYLDIPAGRFLVAEACSGISFLVASVVFGHLYAYISFRTLPKQLLFVFISLIVPIVANALRVYGIVLTAHLTDMEYAAGADHLIYGGVFYAIILFLLIGIGERFRDKNLNIQKLDDSIKLANDKISNLWLAVTSTTLLLVLQSLWLANIETSQSTKIEANYNVDLSKLPLEIETFTLSAWQPYFPKATDIKQGAIQSLNGPKVDFFIATYANGEGELISSMNKLYSAERWVLLRKDVEELNNIRGKISLTKLVSPTGTIRYIAYWYQLGSIKHISNIKIKLYQTLALLMGTPKPQYLFAFSIESSSDLEAAKQSLLDLVEQSYNIKY